MPWSDCDVNYRKLGRTGIRLSEIGLGTWEMSGDVWGKKDDATSIKAINTALDLGVTYIDTAARYGNGRVEKLVGQAIKEREKEGTSAGKTLVSTKVYPKCEEWAPPAHKDIADFFPPD